VALQVARLFVSFGLPLAAFLFLRPSVADGAALVPFLLAGLLLAAATAILPDAVQRSLLCTCVFLRHGSFKVSDAANDLDYYEAQLFWPSDMKYHKTHVLYKEMPEKINPENLSPSTGALSTKDMRENYTKATQAMAADRPEPAALAPIMLGNGARFRPGTIIDLSEQPIGSIPNHAGEPSAVVVPLTHGEAAGPEPVVAVVPDEPVRTDIAKAVAAAASVQAIPGAIGTPPPGHSRPSWEFEARGGWQAFDGDCQAFVEGRYQEFARGEGGPSRKVKTRGMELILDFEEMTQVVEGSHKSRKIRRLE